MSTGLWCLGAWAEFSSRGYRGWGRWSSGLDPRSSEDDRQCKLPCFYTHNPAFRRILSMAEGSTWDAVLPGPHPACVGSLPNPGGEGREPEGFCEDLLKK